MEIPMSRREKYSPEEKARWARERADRIEGDIDERRQEIARLQLELQKLDEEWSIRVSHIPKQGLLNRLLGNPPEWLPEFKAHHYKRSQVSQRLESMQYGLRRAEQELPDRERLAWAMEAKRRKADRQESDRALLARAKNCDRELSGLLRNQIAITSHCPYCSEEFGSENAHLDHIIPIAYGGLSVQTNLVFVCAGCNLRKAALTLNEFIDRNCLDRAAIYERLRESNKRY
jgi:5-methylcytosine-specific restriction endonuclease McrA